MITTNKKTSNLLNQFPLLEIEDRLLGFPLLLISESFPTNKKNLNLPIRKTKRHKNTDEYCGLFMLFFVLVRIGICELHFSFTFQLYFRGCTNAGDNGTFHQLAKTDS